MLSTVFFSWQSDRREKDCRYFIEDALKVAIKNLSQDVELQGAVREGIAFDKDTKDEPGFVKIFETILEKIRKATIFVPDFTFVAQRSNGQPVPNPNVLIEYGYALKAFGENGERRIMPVMNAAYGQPTRETMPFDLIEHRNPITYNLPEAAEAETRKTQQNELTKTFERALKAFFASEFYKSSLPIPEPAQYREPKNGRARFRAEDEPVGISQPTMPMIYQEKPTAVYLADGPAMWLRVAPVLPLDKPRLVMDLESSVQDIASLSLCAGSDFPSTVRAADGCGIYRSLGAEPAPSFAYIFTDGEIWVITTLFLRYYPKLIILEVPRYTETLKQCADYLNKIGIAGPYRWVAGIEGILGRHLPAQYARVPGPGPCTQDVIEKTGTYKIGDDAEAALEPFFAELYDKCGARRPNRPGAGT